LGAEDEFIRSTCSAVPVVALTDARWEMAASTDRTGSEHKLHFVSCMKFAYEWRI
jgi:hypothetical protein